MKITIFTTLQHCKEKK